MKKLVIDLLRSVGLYALIIVGGSFLFLCLSPVFGYLPYSDRPGPGWIGKFPALGWADFWHTVENMFGWSLLLLPYAIVAGVIVFSVARALERFRTPRIVVALVAAIVAGLASEHIVLGIGWYIAIAQAPGYAAMALGVIYGGFLLPRAPAAQRKVQC